ncbi:hypothetical protein [Sphingomonas hankookensis]|uniref:hypothetical protein n=1 Tax=Sphingomonas hankookensis TaxID=563996 RepID=UPI003D303A4A
MTEPSIRIYERLSDGTLEDRQEDYDLESFAGQMPCIGDMIVVPGVLQGLDRSDYRNREVWTVVGRVFNPRDLKGYVALIVEERRPTTQEQSVVAG